MKWIFTALFCILSYAVWGMKTTPGSPRQAHEETIKAVAAHQQKSSALRNEYILPPVLPEQDAKPAAPIEKKTIRAGVGTYEPIPKSFLKPKVSQKKHARVVVKERPDHKASRRRVRPKGLAVVRICRIIQRGVTVCRILR
ncbi:MAG: hypothetical protein WAX57_04115 [Minisyncoccia bacterium]